MQNVKPAETPLPRLTPELQAVVTIAKACYPIKVIFDEWVHQRQTGTGEDRVLMNEVLKTALNEHLRSRGGFPDERFARLLDELSEWHDKMDWQKYDLRKYTAEPRELGL